VPQESLPLPDFTTWSTFPFEGDLRLKKLEDPVAEEPPRQGDDPATCIACQAPDEAYIWVSDRWRVRALDRPSGLPLVLILESRSHLDLGDLPNLLAAELGVMTVRLERAMRSLEGVARVHVNRWGDGAAHLHVWFMARPYGRLQLRGAFLPLWEEVLPPVSDARWREGLAMVAAWLAEFGGRTLVEPPPIDWGAVSLADDNDDADPDGDDADATREYSAAEDDPLEGGPEADAAVAGLLVEDGVGSSGARGGEELGGEDRGGEDLSGEDLSGERRSGGDQGDGTQDGGIQEGASIWFGGGADRAGTGSAETSGAEATSGVDAPPATPAAAVAPPSMAATSGETAPTASPEPSRDRRPSGPGIRSGAGGYATGAGRDGERRVGDATANPTGIGRDGERTVGDATPNPTGDADAAAARATTTGSPDAGRSASDAAGTAKSDATEPVDTGDPRARAGAGGTHPGQSREGPGAGPEGPGGPRRRAGVESGVAPDDFTGGEPAATTGGRTDPDADDSGDPASSTDSGLQAHLTAGNTDAGNATAGNADAGNADTGPTGPGARADGPDTTDDGGTGGDAPPASPGPPAVASPGR
jgi:hypothetical protein